MENVNAEALGENLFCKHIHIYKYANTGCAYVEFDEGIIDMRYNFYSSENLAEVMDMSAMQKSASSLCTSPSIPFQLPGDDSPPY